MQPRKKIIRKCEQVRELCQVRDRQGTSILNKEDCYKVSFFQIISYFTNIFY